MDEHATNPHTGKDENITEKIRDFEFTPEEQRRLSSDPLANTIQEAIEAIDRVLNVHENHTYPADEFALRGAREHLRIMQRQGFK